MSTPPRFYRLRWLAIFVLIAAVAYPQSSRKSPKRHPDTFTVSRADFDRLYTAKAGQVIPAASSRQLHNGKVLINTRNGDMQFIRMKLSAIPKAYLVVQVNGSFSTQTFILTDDHSISYKGAIAGKQVTFTKCDEDEIVSE